MDKEVGEEDPCPAQNSYTSLPLRSGLSSQLNSMNTRMSFMYADTQDLQFWWRTSQSFQLRPWLTEHFM